MKKLSILFVLVLAMQFADAQSVAINKAGNAGNANAALDLSVVLEDTFECDLAGRREKTYLYAGYCAAVMAGTVSCMPDVPRHSSEGQRTAAAAHDWSCVREHVRHNVVEWVVA